MSKTYTGGYRLVSLAFVDLALASTAIAVAGLGDALGIKSRKRVVLTDIVVSGEKKNDVTVQVKKDGNNYVIENVYGYDLEIVTSGSTLKATQHADHITASEIDSGSATAGQVLTADGSGGVEFANPAGGGTKLYKHRTVLPINHVDTSAFSVSFLNQNALPLTYLSTRSEPVTTIDELVDAVVPTEQYYMQFDLGVRSGRYVDSQGTGNDRLMFVRIVANNYPSYQGGKYLSLTFALAIEIANANTTLTTVNLANSIGSAGISDVVVEL